MRSPIEHSYDLRQWSPFSEADLERLTNYLIQHSDYTVITRDVYAALARGEVGEIPTAIGTMYVRVRPGAEGQIGEHRCADF